ncbi:protein of unknown function [Methanoculleus bourgensis]|uniref:Uncharacterized protein n=1 Tax=Methanoculleus bourgensis TaxID=83986 RepID=A0A0X8XYS1_9EURY|nr:protein of unknown function [Methanoculleus bourgensis]
MAASMEPCLFRHGKVRDVGEVGHLQVASMEPCLFRHGKRLNGAGFFSSMPSLQWSHVFSDMVRRLYSY